MAEEGNPLRYANLPRFVVFEGVDGTGKTTFARRLADVYHRLDPKLPVHADAFPGATTGTLGALVYRLHHDELPGAPSRATISPAALQLLHVAAHVDTITSRLAPALQSGAVILDRFWWSTYAYGRRDLSPDQAWALVNAEQPFWDPLPLPVVIYLARRASLKPEDISAHEHEELTTYYREIIEHERARGVTVHEIANDGTLDEAWASVLMSLKIRFGDSRYRGVDNLHL